MKKFIAILMAFALVFSLCGLVACDKSGDGEDSTSGSDKGTQAPSSGDSTKEPSTDGSGSDETTEPPTDETTAGDDETTAGDVEYDRNEFPYEVDGSMMPLSITNEDYIGAPTADAQYFIIEDENVIHDGKGTYNNAANTIGTAVFDGNATTYYDCDENCNYVNTDADSAYGIVLEDWNCEDQTAAIEADNSGYVGAYFENGIKLVQIRYLARSGSTYVNRLTGAVFQASVDGTEWVDIYTVEAGDVVDGFFSDCDVPDEYADTVFKYVRMLGRPHDTLDNPSNTSDWSYCNIAEIEIWGTPAA